MKAFPRFLSNRFQRGFSLSALGPVESRILYDALTAIVTVFVACLFLRAFGGVGPSPYVAPLGVLLLLGWEAALGIYTRLRTATGIVKAGWLTLSLVLSGGMLLIYLRDTSFVVLWMLLAWAPLVLPRVFLDVHNPRTPALRSFAARTHGPILVVGGAGYIGTHVVDLLLREGFAVRVLDRLIYGADPLADFRSHSSFELVEGDATDIMKLTRAMNGASGVVHLAGLVGDPACAVDPAFTRHTNVIATRMVKDVARSFGIPRFVFASSCSVYGVSDAPVGEGSSLNPVSLYARTKIDSEEELLRMVADDFFVTVLRFATVFGHSRRPRFDLVGNLFTAQAMTDGLITVVGPNQWRPFIHVRDLARAIVLVLRSNPTVVQSQVFNVGDARLNLTILQLAETVKRVVERQRPVRITVSENPQDRRNYAVSFDKIRSVLGYQAVFGVEEGVVEMVEQFRKGAYRNYRDPSYSNLAMTRDALAAFQDPMNSLHLYAPLSEAR